MEILAFASFAALVVAWLVAPNTASATSLATRNVETQESVTAAA